MAEDGSQEMIDFFTNSAADTLAVSALAVLEVRSAIRRRQSLKQIDKQDAEAALAILQQETSRIQEQPLTSGLLAIAARLVDSHNLRALDAIQLAGAILLQTHGGIQSRTRFVAADQKLLMAAEAEGFEIWNPATPVVP